MVKTYKNTFYRETSDCFLSYCGLSGPVQRIGKYASLL